MPARATASPASRRTCCAPARAGEIADWLLGQQSEAHAARTRALLLSDPAAQHVGGDGRRAAARGARAARPCPRCRPRPTSRAAGERDSAPPTAGTRRQRGSRPRARAASRGRRLGERGPRRRRPEPARRPGAAAPRGSAARSSSARRSCSWRPCSSSSSPRGDDDAAGRRRRAGRDRHRHGRPPPRRPTTSSSRARRARRRSGLMRLFQANDGTVRFAIAAQGVAPNTAGETYSLWFRKNDGAAQLLGDVKDPVGENGELTVGRPEQRRRRQVPAVVRRVRHDPRHARRQGRQGAGQGHPQR